MLTHLSEILHLIARWVHLIAGIMWIGNSMLFNWLDRNLEKRPEAPPGHVGDIWMVHSGGFYQVEKKMLPPGGLPKVLHWFKWQNGITWLSGISLLVLVYYMGGSAFMVDPGVANISSTVAVAVGVGGLVAGWLGYDLLWRSRIGKRPDLAFALSVLTVLVVSALYFRFLSGRAAYIHVGVLLGTLMTGNVWFVIIPSQRELVAATREGREQDPAIGYQAKARSIHNNYMTFPLLFIMISNHFPTTYASRYNWLALAILSLGSAAIRHFMNVRYAGEEGWLAAAGSTFAVAVIGVFMVTAWATLPRPQSVRTRPDGPVPFAQARGIIQLRCVMCHSAHPSDAVFRVAPNGVMFDTPEQIRGHAYRIRFRAVTLRSMPLGNSTGMTEEEREILGAWIDQGARIP